MLSFYKYFVSNDFRFDKWLKLPVYSISVDFISARTFKLRFKPSSHKKRGFDASVSDARSKIAWS